MTHAELKIAARRAPIVLPDDGPGSLFEGDGLKAPVRGEDEAKAAKASHLPGRISDGADQTSEVIVLRERTRWRRASNRNDGRRRRAS